MQVEENKENIQGVNQVNDEIKTAIEKKYEILQSGFVNLSIGARDNLVKVSIQAPNSKDRIANDVVAVLDISGSMDTQAQVKNKDGQKEGHGLSYLDILKHAVNTVINCLNSNDRFALVSYSDKARIEVPLTYMTQQNKEIASQKLCSLHTEGSTNIWDGLQTAMDLLLKEKESNIHQSIMLLTDGEPNVFPPQGWIPTLKSYQDNHKNAIPIINCYAFGKNIDSQLLDGLAIEGLGTYSFIPCPGFVGTIIVNSISNILCTMGNETSIEIEPLEGTKFKQCFGIHPYLQEEHQKKKQDKHNKKNLIDQVSSLFNWAKRNPNEQLIFKTGEIKFGQTRDMLFEFEDTGKPIQLNIKIKYYDYLNKQYRISDIKNWTPPKEKDYLLEKDYCRLYFVDKVRQANLTMKHDKIENAQKIIVDMKNHIKDIYEKLLKEEETLKQQQNKEFELGRIEISLKSIEALLKDIEGEVTLAFAKSYSYEHWGQHYIPSLSQAHYSQQCNNFIDPGIQEYGGALFKDIRDDAEQTFLKLPPPKKIVQQIEQRQNNQQQQQNPQQQNQKARSPSPVDMAVYYNASGGCFEGNCLVRMASGENKKISDLKKGDIVKGQNESQSAVRALIRIKCPNNETQLVRLPGGLLITPKHPVLVDGVWKKPLELATPETFQCENVFNVVLDKGHVLLVNGIACVTLGHEFKGDKVQHDYFGSQKVINDLQKITGYEKGQVEFPMNAFLRDNITQKVNGININL